VSKYLSKTTLGKKDVFYLTVSEVSVYRTGMAWWNREAHFMVVKKNACTTKPSPFSLFIPTGLQAHVMVSATFELSSPPLVNPLSKHSQAHQVDNQNLPFYPHFINEDIKIQS
jgi:hypothetical protein